MSNTDYKRVYQFINRRGDKEYLVELRDGNNVYGADGGYIEADWVLQYGESWSDRETDRPIAYSFMTGWGNGGPRMDYEYWGDTEELNPVWNEDNTLKDGWELITGWAEVVAFAKSRPGLFEALEPDFCPGCEWERNNQAFIGVRPHVCGKEKSE